MSLEELLDLEVTSVSKRPEKLTEVASAIQVITNEDIRRSGAMNLAEVLRYAPNLQNAQLNSYGWIIGARGFNTVFANKLLVMIDGRTVYSPLFAGVYWDVQSVLLEDVDRIEVISGPGGTLWGANAVNGVINIITKKATDTQGVYVSSAAGSLLKNFIALRFGGKINSKLSYRFYAQRSDRNNTFLPDGKDNHDKWYLMQRGFRMDWDPSEVNTLSVQGNFYDGESQTIPAPSTFDGQNILGRWTHTFSEKSELITQVYFDRTWRRDIPSTFSDELFTYDFDLQHRFVLGKRNSILWGAGYRLMKDKSQNSTVFVGFLPASRDMNLFSAFLQDEIAIVPEQLKLTVGTKLLHNIYTGFEIQPSARMAWTPVEKHTVWGAVSRAVRAPSRIDVDYYIPTYEVPDSVQHVAGGPNFKSEEIIAYELGYRVQPGKKLSLSLAVFKNQYDDIYTVEPTPERPVVYQIQNGVRGNSEGIEVSGIYQLASWWRLKGGYTYFAKNLKNKPGHAFDISYYGNDPKNQFLIHAMFDLPYHFQVDAIIRYVDTLPASAITASPRIPSYYSFNMRLAWVYKIVEISLVGQNLRDKRHAEYGFMQIPQNIYGKITFRL